MTRADRRTYISVAAVYTKVLCSGRVAMTEFARIFFQLHACIFSQHAPQPCIDKPNFKIPYNALLHLRYYTIFTIYFFFLKNETNQFYNECQSVYLVRITENTTYVRLPQLPTANNIYRLSLRDQELWEISNLIESCS